VFHGIHLPAADSSVTNGKRRGDRRVPLPAWVGHPATFDALRLQLSLLFVPAFDYQLRRRERRYDLRLPVSVSLHSDISGEIMAVSENISSNGILLSAEAAIPEGTSIELMVALRRPSPWGNTHLTAAG
jgi:hypothetical protein